MQKKALIVLVVVLCILLIVDVSSQTLATVTWYDKLTNTSQEVKHGDVVNINGYTLSVVVTFEENPRLCYVWVSRKALLLHRYIDSRTGEQREEQVERWVSLYGTYATFNNRSPLNPLNLRIDFSKVNSYGVSLPGEWSLVKWLSLGSVIIQYEFRTGGAKYVKFYVNLAPTLKSEEFIKSDVSPESSEYITEPVNPDTGEIEPESIVDNQTTVNVTWEKGFNLNIVLFLLLIFSFLLLLLGDDE